MKMIPPVSKQNDEMSSEGGLDGKIEVGGDRYMVKYVTARASANPTNNIPHCVTISQQFIFILATVYKRIDTCLCTMVDTIDDW